MCTSVLYMQAHWLLCIHKSIAHRPLLSHPRLCKLTVCPSFPQPRAKRLCKRLADLPLQVASCLCKSLPCVCTGSVISPHVLPPGGACMCTHGHRHPPQSSSCHGPCHWPVHIYQASPQGRFWCFLQQDASTFTSRTWVAFVHILLRSNTLC